MNYEIPLMGLAIHLLVWEKLPAWGNWFNAILNRLPSSIQKLYSDWKCAYCFGFWIALVLHALTDNFTFALIENLAEKFGSSSLILAWFLDALASATIIYVSSISLYAISYPAVKGHLAKQEMMENMKNASD
ncbi:hypothetical protein [Aliikangiella coralliicola]|uniref:DUF1360 domain-containing protein n=1 Tax=Aliikangiella coralliicola TaxID=2592383 RepID=A0A545UE36_9GAMM|nr:hypothetical protein [Aliikangiella coralliicola]TQV87730.1 hypothetical protein FLL46_10110 [Aliikangiella coralliicola]